MIGTTAILAGVVLAAAAGAAAPPATSPQRPAGAEGTVVVPDHFLRRWDPVTVFFNRDVGPAKGGPEDAPERLVTLAPAHPGAYRWLDARTLQFRPAEAWPSLTRFTWKVDGKTTTLVTLMSAPGSTVPAAGSEGLEPVEEIALTFPDPLDPAALARMVTVELRPLPGVGSAGARWLTQDDFQVKTLERTSRDDSASYVLVLESPIPLGTRAVVRFRLSLDDDAEQSFRDVSFSTAEPFRVTALGCRDRRFPVAAEGTRYVREQAIACTSGERSVIVDFSGLPATDLGPVAARNLLRFTPAVANLSFKVEYKTLVATGDFAWETVYALQVRPTPLADTKGRPLEMAAPSEVFVYFPRKPAYVKWGASQGIVERFGPQRVPVEGRAQGRVDVRIHRVPPLDRSFWPFPDFAVVVDDSRRPPGPGEEPPPFTEDRSISATELARQIGALGSPPVSELMALPLTKDGGAATFGLDLEKELTRIAGKGQAGTYLVGLRDVGGNSTRTYMRVQVTDLSLSTSEEPAAVRFVVTSMQTAQAVPGARVRVEGSDGTSWTTLADGTTDAAGAYRWPAPGTSRFRVRRIVVEKDGDTLVLDPARAPETYADNQWSDSQETWLQWTQEELTGRGPQAEILGHIFTERPVYRPDDEVHIKGYLRKRERGRLSPVPMEALLIVEGPGDLAWKYPVTVSAAGSFYHKFAEKELPTGTYRAHLEDKQRLNRWGGVSFSLEAYRLPLFEVSLHGPDRASADAPFDVSLTATYYAGGKVGGQPVSWRVTQYPYTWSPKKLDGFQYSSDGRYSRTERFTSSPRLEREDKTSDTGGASIRLDPTIETTAAPRTYVVEATVTGPDDQTVSATKSIPAVPAFVLGLKVPRYLERAKVITPEVIVAGADGELMADKEVTVRLLRREWHSHLRASDFSDGVARYVTDVVDEKVSETKVKSTAAPLPVRLPIDKSGVYVVEIEAHDRLERAQVVSLDLYAGGDTPVTWSKPPTQVFSVSTDKAKYDPGTSANVVLKSPFQNARALAVVEAPEGNEYHWVEVAGGAATFTLPVKSAFAPRVPVHFILMRGRIAGTAPIPGSNTDLGKPATMAATAWLEVNPLGNQATVTLAHPESARPGQKVDVTITLKDPAGKPLAGEVTLWLVDQAVLALGKEQRLDPLPDFIRPVSSHLQVRDTRNLAFGALPFAESPGGDGDGEEGLLDRTTVRKNFKSVPYYNPAILVGPDGTTTVSVTLSDDLTNFKLRAKAACGPERFGVGTGQIAVRLPVIVQPALPRFVRPGDAFTAAAVGRVVEGKGGPGSAEVQAQGVQVSGGAKRELTLVEGRPERIEFPVTVTTPPYTPAGALSYDQVTFRVAVERTSDQARDAFEVKLPIRDDRERVTRRVLADLEAGKAFVIPAVDEAPRPGTVKRDVLISNQPGLVRMAAGLDYLQNYPYGCTEQQLSRARAYVATRKLRTLLRQSGGDAAVQRAVKETLDWVPSTIDGNGLAAYWPGARGTVSLTAWVVQFLVEAKEAGFTIDEKLLGRLTRSLEQALRSDYSHFVDGESYMERAWALSALAQAGQFNAAYAAELARKAQYLDLESTAEVVQSFARAKQTSSAVTDLTKKLWDGVVFRLYQGKETYGGLQAGGSVRSGRVLPSETRTLAELTRSLARVEPKGPRLPLLVSAIVTLGRDDGWGTTNANASAMLALAELLDSASSQAAAQNVRLRLDGKDQTLELGTGKPVASAVGATLGAGEATLTAGAPVVARVETSYVPAADGSRVASRSEGFVVSREVLKMVGGDAPPVRLPLSEPATTAAYRVGDVVEEHVQVVNPKDRHYVAVVVPLAAGMEPLNPRLATAPPEARPSGRLTQEPTYTAMMDDHVAFYFDSLPAGTFDFYFRTRATTVGSFIQPPAKAEMMYDGTVRGNSVGARVTVER